MDTKKDYLRKQKEIIQQFRAIKQSNKTQSLGLSKQNSNLFRDRKEAKQARIDVKNLNKVISVDKKNLVAEVEGMTTYEDLVTQTLKHNLLPTVVPELATITIGGAVSGGGIEASSFKYGLVHETIEELDILLSNGEVVTARRDNKYKDLFAGVINTFGTLGYVLRVKVKLINATPFVKLRYYHFTDPTEYFNIIEKICHTKKYEHEPVDFLDGMVLDRKNLYVMVANFVETAPYTSNYTYIKKFYESIPKRSEDYLTVRDFIWRWDTDWFWCSKNFGMNNPLLRLLFGKYMLHSKGYWQLVRLDRRYKMLDKWRAITHTQKEEEPVIQDVQIPIHNAVKFLDFFTKNIGILPIWICPTAVYNKKTNFPFYPLDKTKKYINFGFWDVVTAKPKDPSYFNRLVEKTVNNLGGRKGLYSDSFYTREEFWKLYPKKIYEQLKSKYDPDRMFKDVYEKCVLSK